MLIAKKYYTYYNQPYVYPQVDWSSSGVGYSGGYYGGGLPDPVLL